MFDELIPWRRREGSVPERREGFRREFDDLVERFFGREWPSIGRSGMDFVPAVDVEETDGEIMVTAELPGLRKDDLDVRLDQDILTIQGEKKEKREESEEGYRRTERSFGRFSRSFRLPSEIQADKIKAHFKDGVLSLTLPKSEETKAKTRKIEVK